MTAATATRAATAPSRNSRANNRLPNRNPSQQNPYNHRVFPVPAALCRADAHKCDCVKDGNFIDPACGCGNFLLIAYRELRALELRIITRLRDLQLAGQGGKRRGAMVEDSLIFTEHDVEVKLEHFSGIEIEEWPARIAETALYLAEHQANQAMIDTLGIGPASLPLSANDNILVANALRTDWETVTGPTKNLYIMGNPPFIGHQTKDQSQRDDLKLVWGTDKTGSLDYVTGWYAQAMELLNHKDMAGEFAFMSTNSITQGAQVAPLFSRLFNAGWRIKFAHRTFAWSSEAPGVAAVHCVIIGFDRRTRGTARLWNYLPQNLKGDGLETVVTNINGYLADAPNILVIDRPQGKSLGNLPQVDFGAMPLDGSRTLARQGKDSLIIEPDKYDQVMADPIAAKYVRRFVGAEELLHNKPRWCLWLPDLLPSDYASSKELQTRVENCRQWRSEQPVSGDAYKNRNTPTLFRKNRQPTVPYVGVPIVASETRRFFPVAYFPPDVIGSNLIMTVEDPDGFVFSIFSSSAFIAWQKAVGGRLKSDMRFSNTLSWNTFPLPPVTMDHRKAIIAGGQAVLDVRAQHPEWSLAEHYSPNLMRPDLLAAHSQLDRAVDAVFGLKNPTDGKRLAALFASYENLTTAEQLPTRTSKSTKRKNI